MKSLFEYFLDIYFVWIIFGHVVFCNIKLLLKIIDLTSTDLNFHKERGARFLQPFAAETYVGKSYLTSWERTS